MNEWQVDGFDEIRELGAGAQGRVVLAAPRGGGAQVAIKYLAPALLTDETGLAVFRQEAETLSRVADPHVARLYRYVEGPEGAAIVMEAVAGTSLRAVLDQHEDGGLAPEAALAVLKGSLLGLAAAHAVGVVHRDYKPANVVVQPEGTSKLIDFGIAVLTGQSSRAGTPAYMAPEQWQGHPASSATDLYAASCVFFECLTGAKPYRGASTAQLMAQHLNAPVPLESVPEPVRPMLARGLAKNPGERLWDAGEFVAELERTAVAAYGPDWERRGVRALAVAVAALASAAPLAMLGSFAGSEAGAAPGTASLQQTVATRGADAARHSKGLLRHASRSKLAVAGAAAATAAVVVAGGLVLHGQRTGDETRTGARPSADAGSATPTPTTVGGKATGRLRLGIRDGRPYGTSEGPSFAYDFALSPARATPGTRITLIEKIDSRNIEIDQSGRVGAGRKGGAFFFYPVAPGAEGTLPTGRAPLTARGRTKWGRGQEHPGPKGWSIQTVTGTHTFTIPPSTELRPGRYLVTPYSPPAITSLKIKGRDYSPQSLGSYAEGTLPVITILPSAAPAPTATGAAPSPGQPSGGRRCKIYEKDGKIQKRVCY
ncbi:serine/threonine-protein kinase [Actinomadura sp. WMMA1423]|uniref:serine/threonine-protein kinase n=1 Tax=Actinomadura sp. WMMA1423 TaxID=2591108 RepID=UPI001146ED47|nr:serine/threonine-protein kinase [Actinomadura sp. WMMA1423]